MTIRQGNKKNNSFIRSSLVIYKIKYSKSATLFDNDKQLTFSGQVKDMIVI